MSAALRCVVCLWGLLAFSSLAAAAEPGTQQALKVESPTLVPLNFLLYLPQDYAAQKQWPLILFLHGSDERGDDLEQVKVHGPPKLIAVGMRRSRVRAADGRVAPSRHAQGTLRPALGNAGSTPYHGD